MISAAVINPRLRSISHGKIEAYQDKPSASILAANGAKRGSFDISKITKNRLFYVVNGDLIIILYNTCGCSSPLLHCCPLALGTWNPTPLEMVKN